MVICATFVRSLRPTAVVISAGMPPSYGDVFSGAHDPATVVVDYRLLTETKYVVTLHM